MALLLLFLAGFLSLGLGLFRAAFITRGFFFSLPFFIFWFINFVAIIMRVVEGGVAEAVLELTLRLLSRYLHLCGTVWPNEACKQRENFT